MLRGVAQFHEPIGGEVSEQARSFRQDLRYRALDHTDGHVYLDRMPDLTTLGYTIIL